MDIKKQKLIYVDNGITRLSGSPVHRFYTRQYYRNPLMANTPENHLLRLDNIGEEHTVNGYWRSRIHAELFSIEFILEGSMLYEQDGKKYRVDAGSVFFVHPGRNNEFHTGPGKTCHKLAVAISGDCLSRVLNSSGLSEVDVLKLDDPASFEELIRRGCHELADRTPGFRQRCFLLCNEIFYFLAQNLHHASFPAKLREALDLMEFQLATPLTLDDICGELKISPSSLGRLFRDHLGKTPIEHLISMRMQEAQSLLHNLEYSIKEIARRVGYSNQLYFSAEFKKRFGMSPRDYRLKSRVSGE